MDMVWAWPISLLVWTGCVALAYLLGSGFPYGILLLSNKSFAVHKKKNMPKEGLEIENMADILEKEFELVLIVRNDLKMNGGKVAAQCSHAALGLYKELLCRAPKALNRWERCGQRQVVVKIESENDMLVLQERAQSLKLPTHITTEAGWLQIRPRIVSGCF